MMAFCRTCGQEIDDNAVACPHCGAAQQDYTVNQTVNVQATPVVDNGGFGWGLLGFCIPIVGLILFLIWKDEKPRTSKAAGIGALVSVVVSVLFYLIFAVIGIASAAFI